MKAVSLCFAVVLGAFAMFGSAQAAVVRVVVVQTSDAAAYAKEIDKIRAGMKRLGIISTTRVMRARFAGPDAGAVVVVVEYADLAAFAEGDAKVREDAELSAVIKGLDGMRKIVSDSLYEELK